MRGRVRALVVTTIAALACDTPIEPDPFGKVAVRVRVSAEDLARSEVDAARVRYFKTSDGGPGVTLTMSIAGDTASATVSGLDPGSYTVAVEGMNGGALELFGQNTVGVTAGNTAGATITGRLFTPTIGGLPDSTFSLGVDVTYAIARATDASGYDVEWSTTSTDFGGAPSLTSTRADTTVTVTDLGWYYVRARARSIYDVPGVWSAVDSFEVRGDTIGNSSSAADDLGFAPTFGQRLTNLNIAPNTDADWFKLFACRQDTLVVETYAARLTPPSQLNTRLEVLAADLTSLGVNDDNEGTTDSGLSLPLTSSDTVFIQVTSEDGSTGMYELDVQVIAGPENLGASCDVAVADPAQTTAGVPRGTPGVPTTITVTVRDTTGGIYLVGDETVGLAVSGANAGAAIGVDSAVSGVHWGSYVPLVAGDDTIAVQLNGTAIANSPFETVVDPVLPDSALVTAPPLVLQGSNIDVVVQARTASGSAVGVGGATVVVTVAGAHAGTPPVTDNGDGTYTATYVATLAGTDSLTVTFDGVAVPGGPFVTQVVPGLVGLIGYWSFDAGTGQLVADSSGNGIDGVRGSTASPEAEDPAWIPGIVGPGAVQFDGTDHVLIPRDPLLEPLSTISVEAWVRSTATASFDDHILSYRPRGADPAFRPSYGMHWGDPFTQPRDGLVFYVNTTSGLAETPNLGPGVWDGQWHHVVGTFDGNDVRIYLDGVLAASIVAPDPLIAYVTAPDSLLLFGQRDTTSTVGGEYRGDLDGVRIWDRALTDVEIALRATLRNQVVITAPPSDVMPLDTITPAVQVTVRDPAGQTLTAYDDQVTASIRSGTGTQWAQLLGTTTVQLVNGVATFADLSIDSVGTGYELLFTAVSGGFSVVSAPFDVGIVADPGNTTAGVVPTSPTAGDTVTVTVQARDGLGNPVADAGETVAVTVSGVNPSTPPVFDNGDGTYMSTYVPLVSGADTVRISFNGVPIQDSVTVVIVAAGAAFPDSTVWMVTPVMPQVGDSVIVAVQLRDSLANDLNVGGNTIGVTVTGTNPQTPQVTDNVDGSYQASYVPASDGNDSVSVSVDGSDLGAVEVVVSVATGRPASVDLSPDGAVIDVAGAGVVLVATVRDTAGTEIVAPPLTWTSLNPAVATVDGGGNVTGVTAGQAIVEALSDMARGYAVVNVQTSAQPVPVLWSDASGVTDTTIDFVWGTAGDDIWAVGTDGLMMHFDGLQWTMVPSPTSNRLFGVWGSSPTDVWATGESGTLLHYNGTAWVDASPGTTTQQLRAVWGSAPNDVWIVGLSGQVLHFDGTAWTLTQPSATGIESLHSVWGSSADDVWVVAGSGEVFHWDGTTWSSSTILGDVFGHITGTSPVSIWATGLSQVFGYNGSWSPTVLPVTNVIPLQSWSSGPTELWTVGAVPVGPPQVSALMLSTDNGGSWVGWTDGVTPAGLQTIWGTSSGDLWAFGGNSGAGTILRGHRGATLTFAASVDTVVVVGDTTRMAALALDAATNPIVNPLLTWSSSDSGVVTVDSAGLLTATGVGAANIVVSAPGGIVDTVSVTVTAAGGIVGEWRFDESTGQSVGDSSGFGHHGVLGVTASPESSDPVWIGQAGLGALTFDGVDDQVEAPHSGLLEPAAVTVELWVRSDSVPSTKYLFAKSPDGLGDAYALHTQADLRFSITGDGGATQSSPTAAGEGVAVWDGEWHHVAGTFDGASVRLYLDGVEVGTGTAFTGSIGYALLSEKRVMIGRHPTGFEFPGDIDNVRVWSGALSASQIATRATRRRRLTVSVQPSDTRLTLPITPAVEVSFLDTLGNVDASFTGPVTASITPGTGTGGAVLSGTMSVNAVSGVATFSDLEIDMLGTGYTLDFTAEPLAVTSAPFDVNAGPAATVTVNPSGASIAGVGTTQSFTVTAVDAMGNTITSPSVTWNPLNPSVAAVDGSGQATAVASGQTTVSATVDGVTAYGLLSVEVTTGASVNLWEPQANPGNSYFGVWAADDNNVFAVGAGGQAAQFDGSTWTAMPSTGTGADLLAVWGTSPSDVFAVGLGGNILHWGPGGWTSINNSGVTANLHGVWGTAPDNVYAVGEGGGVVLRYDGTNWTSMTNPNTNQMVGIWGADSVGIHAMGTGGVMLEYTTPQWNTVATPPPTSTMRDAWGAGVNQVIGVGDGANVFRNVGTGWADISPGAGITTQNLRGVFGSHANEFFAVGENGVIARYTGVWSADQSGTTEILYDAWTSSHSSTYVVGANGTILRGHRNAVVVITPGGPATLTSLSETLQLIATAEDSTGAAITGIAFSWTSSAAGVATVDATGLVTAVANGTADIIATVPGGAADTVTVNVNQQAATVTVSPDAASLSGVGTATSFTAQAFDGNGFVISSPVIAWGSLNPAVATMNGSGLATSVESGQAILTATVDGTVGTSLVTVDVPAGEVALWVEYPLPTGPAAEDVYGLGPSDIFAVGVDVRRYDGTNWAGVSGGTAGRGVWGASTNDWFTVGDNGGAFRYTGSSWLPMTTNTTELLMAVWGAGPDDVFAVGANGTILHWDGSMWSAMPSGTNSFLRDVWGTSGSNVFAVGGAGTILHYDGTDWDPLVSGTTSELSAIHGVSGTEIYAGGITAGTFTLMRWDGFNWSAMPASTPDPGNTAMRIAGVWASGVNDVYISGWEGGSPNSYIVQHWNGSSWTKRINTQAVNNWGALWGSSQGDLHLTRGNGGMLRGVRDPVLSVNAGDGQMAPAGTTVPIQPSVLLVDHQARGVSEARIEFVASGDGVTGTSFDSTDANGIGSVSWTLGTALGVDSDTLWAFLQTDAGPIDSVSFVATATGIDLGADSVWIVPTNPTSVQTIAVHGSITNSGNATSPSFAWKLTVDGNIVASGTPAFLAPGGTLTASVVAPSAGPYSATVHTAALVVDTLDAVAETDEGNNTASLAFAPTNPSDLTPTEVTGPASVNPGDAISVTVGVTNQGAGTAPSGWIGDLYLSTNTTITTGDTKIGTYSETATLGTGNGVTAVKSANIPGGQPAGTYYLGVIVDATDILAESNEGNNALASVSTITVTTAMADTVEAFHDASILQGDPDANFGSTSDGDAGRYVVMGENASNRWSPTSAASDISGLMQFSLTSIPSTAVVDSAILRVTLFETTGFGDIALRSIVSGPWDESSVTWNNRPALGPNLTTFLTSDCPATCRFDLTSLVQDWIDGSTPNYGVSFIKNGAATWYHSWYSRQHGVDAERPVLLIYWR